MSLLLRLRKQRADKIAEASKLSEVEGRDLTTEEDAQVTALLADAKALDPKIQIQEELETERQKTAEPISGAGPRPRVVTDERDKSKGLFIARVVMANAARKLNGQDPVKYVERNWPGDSVSKDLALSVFSSGGSLSPSEDFRPQLIELLRPMTVVRDSGPIMAPMPNGSLTMPKITGGATGGWIGENQPVPKSEQTTGQLKLTAKKLGVLIPISNDLIRNPQSNADVMVRNDIVKSVAVTEDLAFIRDIGSAYAPTGLRYLINTANRLTVNATVNLANIRQDLGRAERALVTNNVVMTKPGWLMSHRTRIYLREITDANSNKAFPEMSAANPTLNGFPFKVTSQIPENLAVTGTLESEIYLLNWDDVVIGETLNMQIDSSDVAAYDSSGTVKAAFSQDQTVIRLIEEVDIGMRHDFAGCVLTDVDWYQ